MSRRRSLPQLSQERWGRLLTLFGVLNPASPACRISLPWGCLVRPACFCHIVEVQGFSAVKKQACCPPWGPGVSFYGSPVGSVWNMKHVNALGQSYLKSTQCSDWLKRIPCSHRFPLGSSGNCMHPLNLQDQKWKERLVPACSFLKDSYRWSPGGKISTTQTTTESGLFLVSLTRWPNPI